MCARVIAWESACRPLHAQTTLNTSLETLKLPRPAHHQQSQAHSVSHTDAETSSPKHFKAKLHRQKCSFEVRCTGSDRRTRLTRLSPIRSEKPFSPCCTAVHLLDTALQTRRNSKRFRFSHQRTTPRLQKHTKVPVTQPRRKLPLQRSDRIHNKYTELFIQRQPNA